jgi:hypothetical protein
LGHHRQKLAGQGQGLIGHALRFFAATHRNMRGAFDGRQLGQKQGMVGNQRRCLPAHTGRFVALAVLQKVAGQPMNDIGPDFRLGSQQQRLAVIFFGFGGAQGMDQQITPDGQ